mgnify:CR=1 FL=1
MKVFLNSKGKYVNYPCEKWVRPFKKIIESYNIKLIEVDISKDEDRKYIENNCESKDFFIGRFSEHYFPAWVAHYESIAGLFGSRIFPNANEVFYYNDKNKQRKLFENNGYPHPKTIYVENPSDISLPFLWNVWSYLIKYQKKTILTVCAMIL